MSLVSFDWNFSNKFIISFFTFSDDFLDFHHSPLMAESNSLSDGVNARLAPQSALDSYSGQVTLPDLGELIFFSNIIYFIVCFYVLVTSE